MFLAIDVGNSETKLGCFSAETGELLQMWRVTTELRRTGDEYGVFFTQLFATGGIDVREISAVAIASVVPKLDPTLEQACVRFFGVVPAFFRPETQTLMPVLTDRPAEVGADLLAAAIGGRARYGAPLIVVSYGTATVFMAISAAGAYLGVAIAPGVSVSIDALVGRTAKLPQIALEAPGRVLGRNTVESLQAGIVYGFVGQSEALIARMRSEMGVPARVIATGGLADVIGKQCALVDGIDPHLSMIGLKLFHDATRS